MNIAAEVTSILFNARDKAHQLHLTTKSFANHVALGELYDKIADVMDELIEVCQGSDQLMSNEDYEHIGIKQKYSNDPTEFVTQLVNSLKDIRHQVSSVGTDAENIVDELLSVSHKTLYKLKSFR